MSHLGVTLGHGVVTVHLTDCLNRTLVHRQMGKWSLTLSSCHGKILQSTYYISRRGQTVVYPRVRFGSITEICILFRILPTSKIGNAQLVIVNKLIKNIRVLIKSVLRVATSFCVALVAYTL